jgi:hypothetical protein
MSERNQLVFGCDPKAMMVELAPHIELNGLGTVLTSMLSDVQEMLELRRGEDARKALNRIKYIIGEKVPRVYAAPEDVSVREEVGQLRELHAQTTPGTWHALPGRSRVISGTVSPGGFEGFDVLQGHGPQAREAKANAAFSARLHNAAPALLDAAVLVEEILVEQGNLPREQRNDGIVDKAQSTLYALKKTLSK